MTFTKNMGRLTVIMGHNGARMHDYGHGVNVCCVDGWNDSCPTVKLTMSVDELRDLRYMIDRAITYADSPLK